MCHQTVSLAARHLEENGIPTVIMGCAKDIVEYVGVPRFLFSDFPLGNPAGRPNDPRSQALTLDLALRVLEMAPAPRTTVQSLLRWSADPAWKLDYSNIARLSGGGRTPPCRIRPAKGDRQDGPRVLNRAVAGNRFGLPRKPQAVSGGPFSSTVLPSGSVM